MHLKTNLEENENTWLSSIITDIADGQNTWWSMVTKGHLMNRI